MAGSDGTRREGETENPEQIPSTLWRAPVIVPANKPVELWMGPPTRSPPARKVPAAPGENRRAARIQWEEGQEVIRMHQKEKGATECVQDTCGRDG